MKSLSKILTLIVAVTSLSTIAFADKTASQLLDSQWNKIEESCSANFPRSRFLENKCVDAALRVAIITEQRSRRGYNALRPYCSFEFQDSDGDGYGWENNDTCIVLRGKVDKGYRNTQRNSTLLSDSIVGPAILFPQKSNETQLFKIQTTAIENICLNFSRKFFQQNKCFDVLLDQLFYAESRMFYSLNNGRTYCRTTTSDPDGDGYGWENNDTCIVIDSSADKIDNYDVKREIKILNLKNFCGDLRKNRNARGCYVNGLRKLK